jgi:AcrR family transcriptional regulator
MEDTTSEPEAESATLTKGERTRADIIEVAHALFLEKGYNGTSIRDIADRAGIAPGGIYNHFAGKEDIFVAVFMERHPYLEIIPAMNAARGERFEDNVRDAARRMVGVLDARPDFLNLMFIEMVEFKGRHLPGLIDRVLPMAAGLAKRFESAQGRGEIRPLPPLLIMRAFLGLFVSYYITEQFSGNFPSEFRSDALNTFVDIFLHGIVIDGRRGEAVQRVAPFRKSLDRKRGKRPRR